MANEISPILNDVVFNTTAMNLEYDEGNLLPDELAMIEVPPDFDCSMSPFLSEGEEETTSITEFLSNPSFDCSMSPFLPEGEEETTSITEFLSNSSFDIPSAASLSPSISSPRDIVEIYPPLVEMKYEEFLSISFINPPDSYYHVRYVSEITDVPLDGSVVDTRMKTKKNLSGRYLKGLRGRYVTITLPEVLSNASNFYIRVTRLTVPYEDTTFIHPYPLYYSSKKNKYPCVVISNGASIYFKIKKEEFRSGSKQFSNIILTRLKQCELNQMNSLYPFNNNDVSHPFIGANAKNRIARYRLKQSQLDFRLVIRCEQTGKFFDTDIFCRSTALLEAEGTNWRR